MQRVCEFEFPVRVIVAENDFRCYVSHGFTCEKAPAIKPGQVGRISEIVPGYFLALPVAAAAD